MKSALKRFWETPLDQFHEFSKTDKDSGGCLARSFCAGHAVTDCNDENLLLVHGLPALQFERRTDGGILGDTAKKQKRKSAMKRTLAPGHRTVRAWFDTVINPLLRALERESTRLLTYDWTWRFRFSVLEEIRPVAQYLSSETKDNLVQFLDLHPTVKPDINRHDKDVELLAEACRRLHEVLVSKSSLRRLYEEVTDIESLRSVWDQSRFRSIPLADATVERLLFEFFGGYPQSDHVPLLAEYIINNTRELPDHYTTAPFWNRYRERFVQILQSPEVRDEYRRTSAAGTELVHASNRLGQKLQKIRLKLSIRYDVPYVDPTSIQKPEGQWHS